MMERRTLLKIEGKMDKGESSKRKWICEEVQGK